MTAPTETHAPVNSSENSPNRFSLNLSQLALQTIFAFILFLMPTIALEPQDDSIYTVSDFFGYYTQSCMMVKSPGCDVYDPQILLKEAGERFPQLKTHGFYLVGEPPISLTFLLPLALLPAGFALWTYKVFLVLCASLSLALLAQIFYLKERQFLISSVVVALSGPLWEATRVTKPGLIVLLALTLCLLALKRKKPLAAAVCFLPWTFKPQLLTMFLCELLGARQLKFLVYLACASILLGLITLPLFGVANYQAWLAVVKFGNAHPEMNSPFLHPTLRGQLLRFATLPESLVQITSLLAFAAAQIVGLVVGLRLHKRSNWLALSTVCMPLGIVCSPYCHNYDLVILIPSVIAFFKLPGLKTLSKPLRIICISIVSLCLLVFEMPIYHKIHYDFLQTSILTVSPLFCGLFILSIVFVAMVIRETSNPEIEKA